MSKAVIKRMELTVAGRKYPIKVTDEEEQRVKDIENHLNKQIHQFQLQYKDKDKLDSVIMTLLTVAFENTKVLSDLSTTDDIIDKLDQLEGILDSALT